LRGAAGLLALVTVALAAFALTSCTSAPTTKGEVAAIGSADTPFRAGGRLSAKRGTAGATAIFDWDHAADHDTVDLASPFGQVYARIHGAGDSVVVERPGGEGERYTNWTAMSVALLGAPIPMDDLAFWIRAAARAGTRASVERDALGRVLVLRQAAWEIVYSYADDTSSARPSRLVLKYPDAEPVEVRVVVDRWSAAEP